MASRDGNKSTPISDSRNNSTAKKNLVRFGVLPRKQKWNTTLVDCGSMFRIFQGCIFRFHLNFWKVYTVDGRNPANQLIWRIYHYLQGFIYLPGGCLGFLPSTVSPGNLKKKKKRQIKMVFVLGLNPTHFIFVSITRGLLKRPKKKAHFFLMAGKKN